MPFTYNTLCSPPNSLLAQIDYIYLFIIYPYWDNNALVLAKRKKKQHTYIPNASLRAANINRVICVRSRGAV